MFSGCDRIERGSHVLSRMRVNSDGSRKLSSHVHPGKGKAQPLGFIATFAGRWGSLDVIE